MQKISKEERLWPTSISALVASIPALMIGYTFAFPSSALLDLTEDSAGLPEDYRFSIGLADVFAVSAIKAYNLYASPLTSPIIIIAVYNNIAAKCIVFIQTSKVYAHAY